MSTSAALFGAGVGTLVYQLFTKFRSPVFLGSSFAFIGSMLAAFGGAVSVSAGFAGLLLGAVFAGLVYVVIAIVVKLVGVNWINKLMPPVVIGPTVALIGLSLAVNAVNDLKVGKVMVDGVSAASPYVTLLIGIITLLSIFCFSVYGKKMIKLIPFVLGILVGYVVIGVILGGIGIYKPLVEFAGAGATVPLTGFGYTLAKGVKEEVAEVEKVVSVQGVSDELLDFARSLMGRRD